MSAHFRAKSSFLLKDRRRFVIAGEIIDGEVRPKMVVRIRVNSALSLEGKVAGVELLNTEKGCVPALHIEYQDEEEAELWKGLNICDGETLEVVDPS